MEIPKWLYSHINENGLQQIREAVSKAEIKTSAEIVPMIVRRSSAIAHVPVSVFLSLALVWTLFLPEITLLVSRRFHLNDLWIAVVEIAGLLLAILVSPFLTRLSAVQRLFVPEIDEVAQVDDRAELEFYSSNIKSTRDSTGILIFVSMLEHRAVVLADKAIADKFPSAQWKEIVDGLLERIKKGDLAGGFTWAIERSGELVQPYFPVRTGDTNELANDLIIKN